MERIALSVESDYLGSEKARVMVYLNAETDTGQKLSCLITELQRLDKTSFAVGLSGHEVSGWQSEWINHTMEGRSLLRIKFVKPRARKLDAQLFIDYVNANGEMFVRQLNLTLEEKQRVLSEERDANLTRDAANRRADALSDYYKAVRRRAMKKVDVASLIQMMREEIAKAANAMTAAERQAILDVLVSEQVDSLLDNDYYKDVPKEQVIAAMKLEAPAAMPEWIGNVSLMNF